MWHGCTKDRSNTYQVCANTVHFKYLTAMSDDPHIKACLQMIEEQLHWGYSQRWTNYDFEKLSSQIEDKTSIVLSITTLKRIWGKIKYDHSPTVTTLNTLARFLDFADWRMFTNSLTVSERTVSLQPEGLIAAPEAITEKNKRRVSIPFYVALALILFVITLMIFSGKKEATTRPPDSSLFSFKADKMISEGVPNSVVFTYDASAASATDSVFISQTWDTRRKTLVSKNNNKHSAIYYYPGFFRTKLIVDSTIVKTHDLQISSNGWLCLVENDPIPLYFKKEEYLKEDRVEIDKDVLKKYNLSINPIPPNIRFFNQGDLGDLMNDNYTFETTVKNEFKGGSNACQHVEVLIQCKDDIIIIPLAAKSCIGQISLYAAGKRLQSKEADLSGFGADLNQWTTLRIETTNKKMNFFVNKVLAASFIFPHDPTGIVGVQYRFNGVGAVRNTWFENKTKKQVLN